MANANMHQSFLLGSPTSLAVKELRCRPLTFFCWIEHRLFPRSDRVVERTLAILEARDAFGR